MPTDPLTGSRYPQGTDAPNIAQFIQNAVMDLSDNTIPRFATTTARDTAYAAWVAAGGTMADGMTCWCSAPGNFFDRIGGAWVPRPISGLAGSVTTNASGFVDVTHNLGVTPTGVILTPGKQASDLLDRVLSLNVWAKTSTTFTVYAHRTDTSGILATNAIQFAWVVFV